MASISKRLTGAGEARYDVRYRAGGRPVEETFKRRQDAENRVRQVEAEKLTGPVADPRRGREKLILIEDDGWVRSCARPAVTAPSGTP